MNQCPHTPTSIIGKVHRVVVIGDIHGDWKALTKSLKLANLINGRWKWIGGQTHLVQVGDILDRGGRPATYGDEKSESKILRHLFKLQKSARLAGGGVHLLLGNHELMNIAGNFQYVTTHGLSDFAEFGNRQRALQPGGPIAVELACNSNSVLQIGSWTFAHAGILPKISKKHKIEQINSIVRNFLLGNTKLSRESDPDIMDMFWHRKYSNAPAQCMELNAALADIGSRHMVVGHSVQPNGINSDCGGALWRVDVGMSNAFGKGFKAGVEVLEILDDTKVNILKGFSRPTAEQPTVNYEGRWRNKGNP